jgi:hypothetical protein
MRILGFCQWCSKTKLVTVRLVNTKGVAIGTCDDCAEEGRM